MCAGLIMSPNEWATHRNERLLNINNSEQMQSVKGPEIRPIQIRSPKEVDIEDLVPVFQITPRTTFWRNAGIVKEHGDLKTYEYPVGG